MKLPAARLNTYVSGTHLAMSAETKLGCGNRGNRRCWNRWHFEPFGSAGSIGIEFKGRADRCCPHRGTFRVRFALHLQQEIAD